ncbi:MAG: trypsin-like peptidase domain-containing protein [Magnetococcales bacterium]|nr:trypsin-like peptidase domain-containing protein [Magnetococcales bacterium]
MTPEQDPNCGRGFLKYLFMVGAIAIVLLVGTFWWDQHTPGGFYAVRSGGVRTKQAATPPGAGLIGPVAIPVAAVSPLEMTGTTPELPTGVATPVQTRTPTRFAAVARALLPSVVNVSATSTRLPENVLSPAAPAPNTPPAPGTTTRDPGLQYADPFSGVTTESIGSGVVVTEDGYILSNFHVVEKSKHVYVTLFNAQGSNLVLPAEVVTLDAQRDLALLKVDPETPLQPVAFGDSTLVNVGDPVIAIGTPFGLDQTVSQGIVSGKRKAINIGGNMHRGLIQTDAAINRGNSGGPLVDGRGYVIGINTAIYTTTNAFAGVGFAVPANTVREFLEETLRLPTVTPNLPKWTGAGGGAHVAARPPPPIQANAVMPHGDRGPCVNCHEILSTPPGALPAAYNQSAFSGGPPGANGILHRKRVDARYVFDPSGAVGVYPGMAAANGTDGGALSIPPGDGVPSPPNDAGTQEELLASQRLATQFGLTVTVLNLQRIRQQQLPAPKGLMVEAVQPGSMADQAGLRAGDVIHKVEGRWAESPSILEQRLAHAKPGEEVRLAVANGSSRRPVYLHIPPRTPGAATPQQPQAWSVALTSPVGAQPWETAPLPPPTPGLSPTSPPRHSYGQAPHSPSRRV